MPNYNCECDDGFYDHQTLAELRQDVLIGLGYASQLANPPPGIVSMVDNWLKQAQNFLYRKYNALQTERFFGWTLDPANGGERFYGLRANTLAAGCSKRLDAYKITGVFCEDLNNAWYPLFKGIPPTFYTMAVYQGIPARYEIRQCIEIFPAPAAAYTLWIKGHFPPMRFTEDTDVCTLDSTLVYLWALANAKNHYGHPDAGDLADQAKSYLGDLVAGSHGTARYVPGTIDLPPETPPLFLPLES